MSPSQDPNISDTPPDSPWRRDEWVSASDISSYTYCPKAYALARVDRAAPTAKAVKRRRAGNRAHRRFARYFGFQRRAYRWGVGLVLFAGGIALLLTWLRGQL